MEKILKQVYNVELSAQKVELGLAEDLAKATANGKASLDGMNAKLQDLKKIDDQVQQLSKLASKTQQEAYKLASDSMKVMDNIGGYIDRLDATAKELGISPKQIPNYKEALAMYEAIDKAYSEINSFTFTN